MRLTLTSEGREELRRATNAAGYPGTVHLSADAERQTLTIIGDDEHTYRTVVAAEVAAGGECGLRTPQLRPVLESRVAGGLTVSLAGTRATVQALDAEGAEVFAMEIPTSTDPVPSIGDLSEAVKLTMPRKTLLEVLHRTEGFVAQDAGTEPKGLLGVHLSATDGALQATATDSMKLARRSGAITTTTPVSVLLSGHAVAAVRDVLSHAEDDDAALAIITGDSGRFYLRCGKRVLAVPMLKSAYPTIDDSVIPTPEAAKSTVTVSTVQLLPLLATVSHMARLEGSLPALQVQAHPGKGEIELLTDAKDASFSAKLSAVVTGEPVAVCINADALRDGLAMLDASQVTMIPAPGGGAVRWQAEGDASNVFVQSTMNIGGVRVVRDRAAADNAKRETAADAATPAVGETEAA